MPEGNLQTMLTSICAMAQTPSPLTAICHILTVHEARSYFAADRPSFRVDILPVVTALAMAEALALSEGRITLRQVTPAICKRTLSYAARGKRRLSAMAPS